MSFKKVNNYNTIKESTEEKGVYLFDLGTEEGRAEAADFHRLVIIEHTYRARLGKEG